MAETPSPYFIKQQPPPQDGHPELSRLMDSEDSGPNLRDYWRVLKRHRWLILMCAVSMVVCVGLYTFTRTPLYTARATLLIERRAPQVLKIQDALSESIEHAEYFKTQHEILKSRALAARVIKEQGLESNFLFVGQRDAEEKVGFFGGLIQAFREWKASLARPPKRPDEAATGVKPEVIDKYLAMIKIEPIRGTGLVQVGFNAPIPALSTQLANGHAAAYIRYGLSLRSRTNEEALAFLERKLVELKDRVENSEAALNSYRRDKGIISLNEKENIVVDRLSDLNRRLTEAEAERIALEAKVRTIRSGNYSVLPGIVSDPVIQNVKNDIARLEREQIQLAREFKPGYPPLDKVTAQLDASRQRLGAELQEEIKKIQSAYQAARTKETELRARMQEQKAATLNLKDSAVEYTILAREVDTNKQLYDSVLQRIKEVGIAAEAQTSNIYVMENAERPRAPSYPNKRRSLLFALLIGLAGGVGLAFVLEHLDNTFKNPEELEAYVRLPHLGVVPDFRTIGTNGHGPVSRMLGPAKRLNRKWPGRVSQREIVSVYHPLSVVAEAYRTLRSALLLTKAGEPPRTMLLTSAGQGEGKTTTLVNTAIVFAQMGVRVLVIDGDLRRPRCHKILGIENAIGLTEYLAGQIELERIVQPTKIDKLFAITSGALPPNPAELLGSTKMLETINGLRGQFEFIFIDSSPLLAVSDAILMATMVDGVLLVVDGQKTPKQDVRNARLRLNNARTKLLGVLLNRINTREGSYAGYYGHYHDYYREDKESA
jgi:capsular exopolysaccharide synthesis family protein